MHVSVTIDDPVATLMINGSALHREARSDFHRAYKPLLGADNTKVIVVNLSKLDSIDGSAMGMLVLLREHALEAGKTVELAQCPQPIKKTLTVARFHKIFKFSH
jgi:anti-anti-sigma factor